MRYNDLEVGMKVLSNRRRTSNPDFKMHESVLVEVIELGLSHTWRTAGGFSSAGRTRTDKAVMVRPVDGGEPFKQVAANLVVASDDNLARIARYRAEREALETERERRAAELAALVKRFEVLGWEVQGYRKLNGEYTITFVGREAALLAEVLERKPSGT